jgi:hypothetical protein
MKFWCLCVVMMLLPAGGAGAGEHFACNLGALTKDERAQHAKVSKKLLDAVQETKELKNGYAFRMPSGSLVTAAQWIAFERRCCPFFTFGLEQSRDSGPVWLSVTGTEGVKEFIKEEFGLE